MSHRPPWFPRSDMLFSRVFEVFDGTAGQTHPDLPIDPRDFVPVFDRAIDDLRDPAHLPNPAVNRLVTVLWRLIGSKITPVGVSNSVKTIHFWLEGRETGVFAAVVAPPDWPQQFAADSYLAMGGLVFIASQANDFHTRACDMALEQGRRFGREMLLRARAYEAEFYNTISLYSPGTKHPFRCNPYQEEVLREFPLGLASLPREIFHEPRPVVAGDFDLIDRITI